MAPTTTPDDAGANDLRRPDDADQSTTRDPMTPGRSTTGGPMTGDPRPRCKRRTIAQGYRCPAKNAGRRGDSKHAQRLTTAINLESSDRPIDRDQSGLPQLRVLVVHAQPERSAGICNPGRWGVVSPKPGDRRWHQRRRPMTPGRTTTAGPMTPTIDLRRSNDR